ncbi:Leucine-rich repeat domain superfamily [Sesbania bispinosa]|nr:Leucine-rich repeat domain superfamily [Sesbania bispinosa]
MTREEPTKDCISQLPLEVIHEILLLLTMQDVARSSCVSKAWKDFCASLPCVNIDSRSLSYDMLKDVIKEKVRSMSIHKEHLVIQKLSLHLDYNFVQLAEEDLESCIRLISETRTIKEIDFQITNQPYYQASWGYEAFQPSDSKLEVGFCKMLVRVEIQAPSLRKLVFSENRITRREDEFYMDLRIDSETCEALRELTLCNSTIRGKAFSTMFSKCSNVESLVLDRCVHFYRIKIASQRLRKLVLRRCFHLLITDIEAPNLTSFNFCNYLTLDTLEDMADTLNLEDVGDPLKHKHKEEISHQQECQKMVIYPKNKRYDVVVLEDWSAMAELSFMTKISEEAKKTTITTMSFLDLADYIFGDKLKSDTVKILAISSTDESKLYEVTKKKSYISNMEQYFSSVTDKIEVEAFLFGTGPMLSICNANDFSSI